MNRSTKVLVSAFFFGINFFYPCNGQEKKTIVVIGAGISGLTIGHLLTKKGHNVTIYEALNRLGGRVFSAKINGNVTELGGYNLRDGDEAKHMHMLIKEFGLTVKKYFKKNDPQARCTKYFDGIDIIFTKDRLKSLNISVDDLEEDLKRVAQECSSMQEILEWVFCDDQVLYNVFSAKIADYEGAAVEKLSSHCVDTLHYYLRAALNSAYDNNEDDLTPIEYIEGGNALLIEKLAEKLEGKIHLNMPLKKITKKTITTENGKDTYVYELTFKDGQVRTADILVLTIPCPVYKDIDFDENIIPLERIETMSNVLYGSNSKIIIPALSAKKGAGSSYTNGRATLRLDDQNHLVVYYIKNNGIFSPETLENHLAKDWEFIKHSYEVDPELPSPVYAEEKQFMNYTGPVGYCWQNNPYAKGSYSCIGVGQQKSFLEAENYAGQKVKKLFEPIDSTLFFAGEATYLPSDKDRFDFCGTMEAAAESGFRTARIIDSLYPVK